LFVICLRALLQICLSLFFKAQTKCPYLHRVMVAKRVCYEGRVQGVGFRYSVKSLATGYEVVGWVKNLMDGRVELEVQGEAAEVEAFLGAILDSHLRRHITKFVSRDISVKVGRKGFEIAH
jgi:acylphosphatase